MPTITYNFEPTDEVYIIDTCADMDAEIVAPATIYRIDIVVNDRETPEVIGSPPLDQIPSDADITLAREAADATLVQINEQTAIVTAARDESIAASQALAEQETAVSIAQSEYDSALAARQALVDNSDGSPEHLQLIADADAQVSALLIVLDAANAELAIRTSADDSAEVVLDDAISTALSLQEEYQRQIGLAVITTPAAQAVTGNPFIPADVSIMYVMRTSYSESVMIDDESLIFSNAQLAFDVLQSRTA